MGVRFSSARKRTETAAPSLDTKVNKSASLVMCIVQSRAISCNPVQFRVQ